MISSLASANERPASRAAMFLVSNGKPMKPEVLAFLEFILTDGQQYAPEVGYIGLSSDILEEELFKLQE